MLYRSSRLSKIRPVHTYAMPWTVFIGRICRCVGSLSVASVSYFNQTSSFKKCHFLYVYFEFCFVHSAITAASNASFQAEKLSVSQGNADRANGRQILSKVK